MTNKLFQILSFVSVFSSISFGMDWNSPAVLGLMNGTQYYQSLKRKVRNLTLPEENQKKINLENESNFIKGQISDLNKKTEELSQKVKNIQKNQYALFSVIYAHNEAKGNFDTFKEKLKEMSEEEQNLLKLSNDKIDNLDEKKFNIKYIEEQHDKIIRLKREKEEEMKKNEEEIAKLREEKEKKIEEIDNNQSYIDTFNKINSIETVPLVQDQDKIDLMLSLYNEGNVFNNVGQYVGLGEFNQNGAEKITAGNLINGPTGVKSILNTVSDVNLKKKDNGLHVTLPALNNKLDEEKKQKTLQIMRRFYELVNFEYVDVNHINANKKINVFLKPVLKNNALVMDNRLEKFPYDFYNDKAQYHIHVGDFKNDAMSAKRDVQHEFLGKTLTY